MSGAGAAAGLVDVRRSTSARSARSAPVPVVTLALAAAAIIVALTPSLQGLLILDRDRVASGELWRIATGNLVHFSASHFFYDLLVVVAVGWMVERSGRPLLPVLGLSSIAVGMAVLLFAPEIERYGGLSGVACALVVLHALDGMTRKGPECITAVAILVLLVAKLFWEMRTGAFLFVGDASGAIRAVPVAHVAGAAAGIAACLTPGRSRVREGNRNGRTAIQSDLIVVRSAEPPRLLPAHAPIEAPCESCLTAVINAAGAAREAGPESRS